MTGFYILFRVASQPIIELESHYCNNKPTLCLKESITCISGEKLKSTFLKSVPYDSDLNKIQLITPWDGHLQEMRHKVVLLLLNYLTALA